MALEPFVGPWPRFQLLEFYTVSRTPWTGDQPVARPLHIHRTQTSMPEVGFEPTIPVFERAKTVHALETLHTEEKHVSSCGHNERSTYVAYIKYYIEKKNVLCIYYIENYSIILNHKYL
jgi:hypothetical protein